MVEQVPDQGQPAAPLVVEVHQRPRGGLGVGCLQHRLACLGVRGIVFARLHVDGGELPALQRVFKALGEALFLLGLVHREPVLEEQDSVLREQLFELRYLLQKRRRLLRRAKTHHRFDPGAVVPTAVEQHDLASRRQVRHVALEIPLRALAVARLAQGHHMALARVQRVGDRCDHAALARSVPAFDHDHQPLARRKQPARHAVQFELERGKLFQVLALAHLAARVRFRLVLAAHVRRSLSVTHRAN